MAYDNVCNECILKMFDQCKKMVCPHCPFLQLISVTQNSKIHTHRRFWKISVNSRHFLYSVLCCSLLRIANAEFRIEYHCSLI